MKLSRTQGSIEKNSSESRPLTALRTASVLSDLVLLDDGSMGRFRKRWNKLYRRYSNEELLKRRDELRYFWHHIKPSRPFTRVEDVFHHTEYTERLENDYDYSGAPDRGVRLPQFICEYWLHAEREGLFVDWRAGQIKARPTSLPTVLVIGCLYHAEYLRICLNNACRVRYFIAARKDQRYCSSECAEPAKLAAKLKWWHENRGRNKKGGA